MPINITVPGVESFDEETEKFVYSEDTVLELEHSLVSLSKWEQMFHKPFLGKGEKTSEETLEYIKAMCLNSKVDDEVFLRITEANVAVINAYIENPMTATTFANIPGGPASRELITNEIIRYWMVSFQIPLEYETRHLNQLFTLVKVINEKNKPDKNRQKMTAAQRHALNKQRQQQHRTTG